MNRSAFAPAVALLFAAVATTAFAQAKPAAPTTAAPAQKAKFAMPLKGDAAIQVIPGNSRFDAKAKEVLTTYKIKNMSAAPIAALKIEEFWYQDKKMVSSDTQRYLKPFQPGEIIEMTTHAPATGNPSGWSKNAVFTHANGKVIPKAVKKFE